MIQQRDKLLEIRNEQRKQELEAAQVLTDKDKQKAALDQKVKEREQKKNGVEEKKEEEKMGILDDDFLADLKMVDVPDSDDECYF